MKFSDWYEKEKEALTQATFTHALREAWESGYAVATKEMYKAVVDGMRGKKFRDQENMRKATRELSPIVCEMCDYIGPLDSYAPCIVGYSDIRCPKCGSTKNAHNKAFKEQIFKPGKAR